MKDNFVVNFAPTGMIPTKEMTSHVPITCEEIIADVHDAIEEQLVTMVHLHARDEDGKPTYKKEVYKKIIYGIRQLDEKIIITVSTSGRIWNDFASRSECLEISGDLKPDMASLTLSSLNFNKQASMNSPEMIVDLALKMKENGIKPELEAFDIGMINYAKYLGTKGILEYPFYINLILGNISCAQPNMLSLGMMINDLPERTFWSVGGVGDCQLQMNVEALINGGGVRVGIEDNIFYDKRRKKLAKNIDLLRRIRKISKAMEKEIWDSSSFRKEIFV